MFTQPCFIRKNTPDLIRSLTELGYKHTPSTIKPITPLLVVSNGFYACNFPYSCENKNIFIDCMNNEKLFLAMAAVRDDSDKNQWFIIDDYVGQEALPRNFIGSMHFCTADKYERCFPHYFQYHKATVDELIKYFRDEQYKNTI